MVECESYDIHFIANLLFVLIDTWWNVNFLKMKDFLISLSFNRYMVECELIYHKLIFVLRKVLIDTWWNVNFCVCPIQIRENLVLIDTWWNVNKETDNS